MLLPTFLLSPLFGITADRDVMPDLGDVAASIEHEFAVLAKRR